MCNRLVRDAADADAVIRGRCQSPGYGGPMTVIVLGAGIVPTMFQPGTSFEARSGCVRSMPESITATTTELEPVVTPHAAGAEICVRCHSELKSGSLRVTEPVRA